MLVRRWTIAALVTTAFAILTPTGAQAHPATCGSTLTPADAQRIIGLSDTRTITGATPLAQLEDIVARNDEITRILVAHHDRRGLFSVGLDGVEDVAVMPLQRSKRFHDPNYAQRMSRDLAARWLDAVHAEFANLPQSYHWARFFELTRACQVSDARTAMAGYNAHLTVDLPLTIAQTGSLPDDADDYFTIVDAIASNSPAAIDPTTAAYGRDADFEPLWTFYWVGDIADALTGPRVGSTQVTRTADISANVVLWNNGLALENPGARPAVEGAIRTMFDTGDAAFATLAAGGAL